MGFFLNSLKNMRTTASIAPSSKYVCKKMTSHLDFENADVIVELGAGDGVITKHILAQMGPDTKLMVFEILDDFCEKLREIDDSRLIIIQDTAENLGQHLKKHGFEQAHDVISAVPFVMLPEKDSRSIIGEVKKYIRSGGKFIQLHYSTLVKRFYEDIFGNVKIQFAPFNIPPALLHISIG